MCVFLLPDGSTCGFTVPQVSTYYSHFSQLAVFARFLQFKIITIVVSDNKMITYIVEIMIPLKRTVMRLSPFLSPSELLITIIFTLTSLVIIVILDKVIKTDM